MGVFENFTLDDYGNIVNNAWIEWDHFLIPNKPELLRNIMRKLMSFFGHCKKCTALDGCYLLDNNRPEQPLHPNCDCKNKKINKNLVKLKSFAELPIIKLTKYIFNGMDKSKGKQSIFESWGYTIENVNELKISLESQAKNNYITGKYVLKGLDVYGQRLAIPVELKGNIFYSGWMLKPEGEIKNTTPFGGWVK